MGPWQSHVVSQGEVQGATAASEQLQYQFRLENEMNSALPLSLHRQRKRKHHSQPKSPSLQFKYFTCCALSDGVLGLLCSNLL